MCRSHAPECRTVVLNVIGQQIARQKVEGTNCNKWLLKVCYFLQWTSAIDRGTSCLRQRSQSHNASGPINSAVYLGVIATIRSFRETYECCSFKESTHLYLTLLVLLAFVITFYTAQTVMHRYMFPVINYYINLDETTHIEVLER